MFTSSDQQTVFLLKSKVSGPSRQDSALSLTERRLQCQMALQISKVLEVIVSSEKDIVKKHKEHQTVATLSSKVRGRKPDKLVYGVCEQLLLASRPQFQSHVYKFGILSRVSGSTVRARVSPSLVASRRLGIGGIVHSIEA